MTKETQEMTIEIKKMISCKAIRISRLKRGFLSRMFLRRKPDGSNRPIFNLKRLNTYVQTPKFRLLNHMKIPSLIDKQDHMMKIDLSQAYFHVPVKSSHCRFLMLAYQGRIYEMTCLPFGLASAPAAFAKLTNWVAHQLRLQGIKIVVYLDDFLLIHENPDILEKQAHFVREYLRKLGWLINLQKSSSKPTTELEYLGIVWDTVKNKKRLGKKKVEHLTSDIKYLLNVQHWSWQDAKIILGKLNFASFVVPLGRLHCRILQRESNQLSKENRHKKMPISQTALQELDWWRKNNSQKTLIHTPDPVVFITTDASDQGWGAVVNGQKLWGTWTTKQRSWHSNQKELWTLYEVLKRLRSFLKKKSLMWQTDNRTSVAYITKQGGTKSLRLLKTTTMILELCQIMKCQLIARYIPGICNGLADRLSRLKSMPEWHLKQEIVLWIFRQLGTPQIDLFASRRSATLPCYVSEDVKDMNSQFTDAFSRRWDYQLGWIFPHPRTHSTSTTTLENVEGTLSACDTEMGESLLGQRNKRSSRLLPSCHSGSEEQPHRPANKPGPARSRSPKFGGMEGTGWTSHLTGWNSSEKDILESSWRSSTMKTYRPAWNRWREYAIVNEIASDNPNPADIAKYLCHLYTTVGLAPKTIALHKSVVTTLANPARSDELSTHPLVRHTLKGILLRNPPKKKLISWAIEDFISFLDTYNLNDNSLFEVSRHACVLLLLASGRRVHDLTLFTLEDESYQDNGDCITLWPKFGSKTDSFTHRQSGWCLKQLPSNVNERRNPVLWIRKLVSLSQSRRGTVKSLFVSTRGKVKPASRSIIAGWIRTLFREAGISASAGSFRAAVASSNFSSNRYDIDEVLKRGNWKSKNTFFRYYFKELPIARTPLVNPVSESFSPLE